MRLAIIGTGNVGSAIARGLLGKGHAITFGTRKPEASAELAIQTGASLATPADAAGEADIVILALPWPAAKEAIAALGDLSGKIVIDCINPLGMVGGALDLVIGHTTSGAEIVQGWLPGARVVKTLNQVGAEIMAHNAHLPARPVQFMAGDDDAAKTTVASLLRDMGFDPLDAGPLTRARLLEPLAMVWINQALIRGKGRDWALGVVQP